MKKFVTILLIVSILCTCMAFAAGCNTDKGTIRLVEVTHSVFYAPLYVAMEQGYFEEEGIKIELSNGGGADKCMTAIIAGAADIGLMGAESSIYCYNEGKQDYPVIFGQLTRKDGSFLMARTAMPDFKWSDIAGKSIIGGRPGGMPAMALEFALKKNNLIDGNNFTMIKNVAYDMTGPSFIGGTGDFCTMFEPAASNMELAKQGYKVASVGKEAGDMPFTAFQAASSYLEKNPAQAEGFIRAIVKGMKFVEEKSAAEIAAAVKGQFKETDIKVLEAAIGAYKTIEAYCYSPIMKEADFNLLQDVIVAAGVMSERAVYADLVNNTIGQKVMDALAK